jgi:hypothetical protein
MQMLIVACTPAGDGPPPTAELFAEVSARFLI